MKITIEVPAGKTTDALIRYAYGMGELHRLTVKCHLTISAPPKLAGRILQGLRSIGLQLPMYLSDTERHEHRPA